MKNILITGFEPFGGEKINPSYEAVNHHRLKSMAYGQTPSIEYPNHNLHRYGRFTQTAAVA